MTRDLSGDSGSQVCLLCYRRAVNLDSLEYCLASYHGVVAIWRFVEAVDGRRNA